MKIRSIKFTVEALTEKEKCKFLNDIINKYCIIYNTTWKIAANEWEDRKNIGWGTVSQRLPSEFDAFPLSGHAQKHVYLDAISDVLTTSLKLHGQKPDMFVMNNVCKLPDLVSKITLYEKTNMLWSNYLDLFVDEYRMPIFGLSGAFIDPTGHILELGIVKGPIGFLISINPVQHKCSSCEC